MKRLILIPTIVAVLGMLAVFPMAFASHSTPFNGSFSGTFKLTSRTSAVITGAGHAEHLGETSFAAAATDTGPATCEGGFVATEQETYTAANGDQVFSSSHDVGCPTSQTTFHIAGSWTITGGTGRFDHASGTGTVSVNGVMTSSTSGTFSLSITGTIAY
jgi:hypothetical protein